MKFKLRISGVFLFLLLSTLGFTQTEESTTNQQISQQPVTNESNSGPQYSTPPKKKQSIVKRFYIGGYLGLQFGTYTSIDISPLIGYRITPDFNVGIGLLYTYTSFDYGFPIGQHGYSSWGGRLSTNYTLFNLISLGVEYQYRTVELYNSFENSFQNQGVNVLFLGGGIRQSVGRNTFMFVMAYYDILQEQYTPYPNVVFRIGVSAGI
jgi:hypothetical protein